MNMDGERMPYLDQRRLIISDDQQDLIKSDLVGGKAANLLWLHRHAYRVPPFVVVSTEAFALTLAALATTEQGAALAAATEPLHKAKILRHLLLQSSLPREVDAALKQHFGRFEGHFLAVRSSVVGEDSVQASFAGQMETLLFQKSYTDICQAIMQCFASAYAERAMLYRLEHQLPTDDIKAAVVCQQMIDADVAGVVFTANPANGNRKQLLISAAYGLGEGVVSGECNADEFVLEITGEQVSIITRQISDKDQAVRFAREKGRGTELCEVAKEARLRPCLNDTELQQLARLSHALALRKGQHQDIEFAIKDGAIYWLQTRPVTKLPAPRSGTTTVWDNSNIQESYCGVTTPLTFSFASRAYRSVYVNTAQVMGMSSKDISAMDYELRNLLGLLRGRIYYNINSWYLGLSSLPGMSANKADMERMMGLSDPVDFVQPRPATGLEKVLGTIKKVSVLLRLLGKFARLDVLVQEFRANFARVYQEIDRQRLFLADTSELQNLCKLLQTQLINNWTTPIINDFYVMMMNGRMHRKLEALGVENPSLTLNNLLSGEEGIESTEPTKFLLDLCDKIRLNAPLRDLITTTPNSDLLATLEMKYPDFHRLCLSYIDAYGDRTIGELKLESVTLRQDASFMFQCLKNYLDNPKLSLSTLQRHEQELRSREEAKLRDKAKGPWQRRALASNLKRLRTAVKNRENMRLARTRMFGLYRSIYLEMAKQLVMHGLLGDARDVFYLTVDELDMFFEGRAVAMDFKALVDIRKMEYRAYLGDDLPHHFVTAGSPYLAGRYEYHGPHQGVANELTLKGLGCYPGVVEAKVRLIFSPDEELSLSGQILCTVRTDPGWAPLFPSASGIIVERGSSLSHSAVVARELGIPAIVNIPGLTKTLRDGERIRMNGQSGLIERLDPLP